MISVNSYTAGGKLGDKVKLPEAVFGVEAALDTIAQAIRVFLANQRSARAKSKTRSEVAKTTAKMYRQKGTGRARHGSYSAPIFVGGGVAHGPTGRQNYKLSVPKLANKIALLGALSIKAKGGEVAVISINDKLVKTKEAGVIVSAINENKMLRTLVVVSSQQRGILKAMRNLPKVEVVMPNQLNTYTVVKSSKVLFTNGAIDELTNIFGGKNAN